MSLRISVVILSLFFCLNSYAGELDDIQLLLNKKQYNAALTQVNNFIEANQRHAQARFLKGFILTEMGKIDEAIEVFSRLSSDYPKLPEPYNNLAVLYAQQGQFEQARATLQVAIQVNPTYAIAYENLGDLHVRFASEAYQKAARLEQNNPVLQKKFKFVQNIISTDQGTRPPVTETQPKKATVTGFQATPIPVPSNSLGLESSQMLVEATVKAWASNWSHKNIDAHLAAYSKTFRSFDGKDFAEWGQERKQRITESNILNVMLSNIKVEMLSKTWAKVRMQQSYVSDKTTSTSNKMLVMQKIGESWLIEREYTSD